VVLFGGFDNYWLDDTWTWDGINWNGDQPTTKDCFQFGSDLTIPDGTHVQPGQSLHKGWRLSNCGNTTWSGYSAVRTADSFGPGSFGVPAVSPNNTGDLYMDTTAPSTAGHYRVTYELANAQGEKFQFGTTFFLDINVDSGGGGIPAITSPIFGSSVCTYAKSVLGIIDLAALGGAGLGDAPHNAQAARTSLDVLQQFVALAAAVAPPDGLEDFRANLIGAFQTFVNALQPVVAALNAGDQEQVHTIIDSAINALQGAIDGAVNDLEQQHPDVKEQLDGCNTNPL
jgi:Ig-like domain from next to BRCA1 gene